MARKNTRKLDLYNEYSREEVHAIFSPGTTFTPQTGTWGLQGIAPIPERSGDFVFFVTFGTTQGERTFDEGVTSDGVLSWQSQPKQSFSDTQILQFISHDDLTNSIYLFLRTQKRRKYTYLGRLKYLSHDQDREQPVFFQWQILDWEITANALNTMQLVLQRATESDLPTSQSNTLYQTDPPLQLADKSFPTSKFRTYKASDRSRQDAENTKLGLSGELLVLEWEIQRLRKANREDLAEAVRHISVVEGDGAGYDIHSFNEQGDDIFVEVKTTKGSITTPFFMSSNEVEFAEKHQDRYRLYRVYNYDDKQNSALFYLIEGPIKRSFNITPTQFRVSR